MEIAQPDGTSHLVVIEQVGKIFLCKLRDMKESVALVLAFLLFLGLFLFLNLNVVFLSQPTQSLGISVVLMLHEEFHHIAGLAATEAFENAFGGRYIERRRLLVVERATSNMVGTTLAQRYKVANHLLDTGGVHDALYGFLVYHANWGAKIRFFFDIG